MGMCGPIVYAIPIGRFSGLDRVWAILLYHLGRVLTYTSMGIIAGAAGVGIALGKYQQPLSLAIGILMLLWALVSVVRHIHVAAPTFWLSWLSGLQSRMGNLLRTASLPAIFGVGVINGLLPCGLVYTALTGALGMAGIPEGGIFMGLFGIGTIPALAALMWMGSRLKEKIAPFMRVAMPIMVVLLGILLILRGLNLGIPYISPEINLVDGTTGGCCSGH